MTISETQKTRRNYNNEPLKDNEVLVLMPFFEEDRINITNPDSIVTVQTAGGPVVAVLKAVPKEFASIARSQFNSYARDEKPVFYGRCLIPQSDGSKKPCPKKNGDNHPDCAHCPHRNEYEREMPRFVSIDELEDEYGYCPISSPSPEEIYMKEEAEEESASRTENALDKFYIAYPVEDSGVFETMHVTSAEVISVRFGKKKCKVILVETKDEAIYKGCMREIWRDLSREYREHRRGLPLSLEAEYMINGFEPEDPSDVEETKTLQIVFEELFIKLRKLNPKYADILEQLYEGCTQEEISIRTGKSLSTIQEQIALAFAIVRAMLEK